MIEEEIVSRPTTESVDERLCASTHPMSLDHIAAAEQGVAAAERWHTQVLGFRCVDRKKVTGKGSGMISWMMQASIVFVLLQGTQPAQASRFIEHFDQGVQHIATRVKDSVRHLVRQLEDSDEI